MTSAAFDAVEPAPDLAVVILNYKGYEDTIECLDSIVDGEYQSYQLIVVDNASPNESVSKIRDWAARREVEIVDDLDLSDPGSRIDGSFVPQTLSLIKNRGNLGFSSGNNRGIEYALSTDVPYIMILNNDSIVTNGALSRLVTTLDSDPDIGSVFPRIVGTDGKLQVPVYLRPPETLTGILIRSNHGAIISDRYSRDNYLRRTNPHPDYSYDEPIRVANTVSAHSIWRREVFQEQGLLDESMFMYYEEYVLAQKLDDGGYQSVLEPRATIIHKGGMDNSRLPTGWLFKQRCKSEMHYVKEYTDFGPGRRALLKALRTCEYLVRSSRDGEYRSGLGDFVREYLVNG